MTKKSCLQLISALIATSRLDSKYIYYNVSGYVSFNKIMLHCRSFAAVPPTAIQH